MIRVAFASTDDTHVDMHFGASERLVVFEIAPNRARLVRVGDFPRVEMKGANRFLGVAVEEQQRTLADYLRAIPGMRRLYGVFFRHRRLFMPQERPDRTEPYAPSRDEVGPPSDRPPEDKVVAKLDFLKDCAAVYAASIGASSVKRLMSLEIQPIIVEQGHDVLDLLNRVNAALQRGGVPWVEQALAKAGVERAARRATAEGTTAAATGDVGRGGRV
jgi:nitrogen fixation protein NifX